MKDRYEEIWNSATPAQEVMLEALIKTFDAEPCEDPEGTYVVPLRPVRIDP